MAALLDLVCRLIEHGKELAATLHQRIAEQPYFAVFNYATNDLALVTARITRGLMRAAALQERLTRICGRARPDYGDHSCSATKKSTSPRKPRPRPSARHTDDADLLTDMPTAQQIAAEVRRRPIGAVIVDICCDLAILPCHPLWRDIQKAINDHGGSYVRLLKHVIGRNYALAAELVVPAEPPSPSPAGTGPP